ncbi:MAG: hypothetical protein F6K03_18010 [Kamptonema sp. SIO4C4]|nr:hypothetical protein [Kamptonema sp. SIO4C4]
MDSSDGLADAVIQLCRASGVGARLYREAIAFPLGLEKFVSPKTAWEWVFYGGEDFELVLCLAPDMATAFLEQLSGEAAIIGEITAKPDILLCDRPFSQSQKSPSPPQKLTLNQGFQHFSG